MKNKQCKNSITLNFHSYIRFIFVLREHVYYYTPRIPVLTVFCEGDNFQHFAVTRKYLQKKNTVSLVLFNNILYTQGPN